MYKCKTCGWKGEVNGRQRCLACARIRIKEWRKKNPEKAREQKRRWEKKFRKERREEYNARRRKKRNSIKNSEAYYRRKKWLMSGTVKRLQLIKIWEKANGLCSICGKKAGTPRFTPFDMRGFDHIKSRINGGQNNADNIQVCCRKCNERKG
jgi:5-methylcytosine-specific restriction endonuclease McrA